MLFWFENRKLPYFVCLFPAFILALLPLPNLGFDFLSIFTLIFTACFAFLCLVLENPFKSNWFTILSLAALTLRMGLIGNAARKIILQGPAFDGQLMRNVGEIFHSQTVETHLTIAILSYVVFRSAILLIVNNIYSFIQVLKGLSSEINSLKKHLEGNPHAPQDENARAELYGISLFFAKVARIEINVYPVIISCAILGAITNRDHFTANALAKSIETAVLLSLSLIICFLPTSIMNVYALREWLSQALGKPLARLNFRELLHLNRKWAMALGGIFILLSFIPDFPKTLLIVIGGGLFAAGFISDVTEPGIPSYFQDSVDLENHTPPIFHHEQRVKLQLGRGIWNDYFVGHEDKLNVAANLTRLSIIQETGTIIEEILIEFNTRLQPESIAVLVNNRRVFITKLEVHEHLNPNISHDFIDLSAMEPASVMATEAEASEHLILQICKNLAEVLREQVSYLSYDPAVEHLVKDMD